MANVFDFLKPKASLNRNGFDLSQRHIYSTRAGLELPVLCLDCIPNDYHYLDLVSLVRSMPVKTDAFTRLQCRFKFGFVPYWQIWHRWNEFISQTQERFSISDPDQLASNVPTFNLGETIWYALTTALQAGEHDMFNFDKVEYFFRALDMFGYGSYYNYLNITRDIIYNTDRVNYPSMSDDAWTAWLNKWSDYSLKMHDDIYNSHDVNLNIFRAAAFNKFMQDYNRSLQYEDLNPLLFNLDLEQGSTSISAWRAFEIISQSYYSLYKKDMFTSLMPSPQFGAVSSVDLGTFNLFVPENTYNNATIGVTANTDYGTPVNRVSILGPQGPMQRVFSNFESNASIDVYQLRKAEMFQKWKEDKLRAGNKLSNQQEAMWGTTFRYSLDNYSEFVKEISFNVSIDEVTNLSAQGDAALGEIGGKGIGTGNGHLEFKCRDFGVLVCSMSIVPVAEYDSVGLDKNNTLVEPFDFATPHFENLGFEAIYGYQLSNNLITMQGDWSESGSTYGKDNFSKTLGFAPRYLNYKTAVDKVHGLFQSNVRARVSLTEPAVGQEQRFVTQIFNGDFSHWVTPREDLESVYDDSVSYPVEMLHVNPHSLDSIFYANVNNFMASDQFLCNTNFVINSVRSLSVLGLPRW